VSDGKLFCPLCSRRVEVVWLGNRLIYRPHSDSLGNRCPKSERPVPGR
jgi:hypothetical protein